MRGRRRLRCRASLVIVGLSRKRSVQNARKIRRTGTGPKQKESEVETGPRRLVANPDHVVSDCLGTAACRHLPGLPRRKKSDLLKKFTGISRRSGSSRRKKVSAEKISAEKISAGPERPREKTWPRIQIGGVTTIGILSL